MKKILILAYDFPPYLSVGGLRPYSWFKYLHEFDVYPIVVTRQWSDKYKNSLDYIAPSASGQILQEKTINGIEIRTPYFPNLANRLLLKYGYDKYRLVRKMISAFYEFTQFIFFIGPKSELYFAAKQYLEQNNVDCIIATGDPYVLFRYAATLSKKFNIPWIADYRDPWSQDIKIRNNFLIKQWNSFLEKKIVSDSTLIITVSLFFKYQISRLIKNKEFEIIPNGYDHEIVEKLDHIKQQSKDLSIALAGTILRWHPIRSVLSVISSFITDNPQVRLLFNFYGINIEHELNDIISRDFSNIKSHVKIYPKMDNHLVMEELAKNNIMLLFNYYSYMGTKIYDYIGVRRLILFCYANDIESELLKNKYYNLDDEGSKSSQLQVDLINETKSGIIVKNALHLRILLDDLYTEFKTYGFIACNSINIEKYSRKIQVKKLAEIINNIAAILLCFIGISWSLFN